MKNGLIGVRVDDMDSDLYTGMCEASTPWKLANPAAVLYPSQFQPWEADNEAFLEESNGLYTLTYQGDIAFNNYLKEADILLARCKESVRPL